MIFINWTCAGTNWSVGGRVGSLKWVTRWRCRWRRWTGSRNRWISRLPIRDWGMSHERNEEDVTHVELLKCYMVTMERRGHSAMNGSGVPYGTRGFHASFPGTASLAYIPCPSGTCNLRYGQLMAGSGQ